MTQTTPNIDEIFEVVRTKAAKYFDEPPVDKQAMIAKVKELAARDPQKAQKVVEAVADALAQRSGGQHSGQVDQLQAQARAALGLSKSR